jgi:glutamyl-Q tRNA(Asp) synthetase
VSAEGRAADAVRPGAVAARIPAGFVTRFAPAPTGYLHLGHAVNAAWTWGLARARGGRVLLRIEDHDRGRCRPEYEAALLEDLDWLGLVPDGARTGDFRAGAHPQRQGDNTARYAHHLRSLESQGLVYPCRCSRAEIAEAAREASEDGVVYPGTCRTASVDPRETSARRVRLDGEDSAGVERFDDLRLGPKAQDPMHQCGDLLVRDRLGHWTYQFAVVVDDMEQGVDLVIRGEDLLSSTGRQLRLARLLGRTTPPRFLHHPLVRTPEGRKLSKSDGDTGLRELRAAGRAPEEVLGLAAQLGGLQARPEPIAASALGSLFG